MKSDKSTERIDERVNEWRAVESRIRSRHQVERKALSDAQAYELAEVCKKWQPWSGMG